MSEPVSVTRCALGMISLRCDLGEPRLAEALGPLPGPRRIVFAGGEALAWMSPDELMLFAPVETVAARRAGIAAALGGAHHLATDVSDARAVFRLEGAGAREVLAKGAPVDLAPGAFGPGDFRRTRLGQVAAAFWTQNGRDFDVMCFRSVAGFVEGWLAVAAAAGSPGFFREA